MRVRDWYSEGCSSELFGVRPAADRRSAVATGDAVVADGNATCAGCRSAEAQCRSTVIRGLRTMPEGTALQCGRACTMAHGDTFALGHAVEADCGALTIDRKSTRLNSSH